MQADSLHAAVPRAAASALRSRYPQFPSLTTLNSASLPAASTSLHHLKQAPPACLISQQRSFSRDTARIALESSIRIITLPKNEIIKGPIVSTSRKAENKS